MIPVAAGLPPLGAVAGNAGPPAASHGIIVAKLDYTPKSSDYL